MTSKPMSRYHKYAILALCFVIIPLIANVFVARNFYWHLIIIVGIMTIATLGLGFIIAAAQPSMAHGAFYGIGAYTSALVTLRLGWPFWLGLVGACIAAAIVGIVIGLPSLRLKGVHFAMVTFAFGELIHIIFLNWKDMTHGDNGLQGIPVPSLLSINFGSKMNYAYLVLAFVLLTVFVIDKLLNSRVGRALVAIRENETLAEAMGIDVMRYKVFAFSTAALFAGLAGSLYAHYMRFISPVSFTSSESMTFIAMLIIGGVGTIVGPVIGASLFTLLPELLRSAQDYTYVIFGLILMLTIIFMPTGIVGFARSLWGRRTAQKQPTERTAAVESHGDTAG